uniref:Uncharacterized protein n=1 Tax=Schistocephalus solidus TaxID=70667 RepID=A0A0X3PWS5_SCHSO
MLEGQSKGQDRSRFILGSFSSLYPNSCASNIMSCICNQVDFGLKFLILKFVRFMPRSISRSPKSLPASPTDAPIDDYTFQPRDRPWFTNTSVDIRTRTKP